MVLSVDVNGKPFLKVYGDREAVDVALQTWWQYYHPRSVVVEEFAIWRQKITIVLE